MSRRIYLIGALKNPMIPLVANALEADGHTVVDDWFAPGPETDQHWQAYETARGRNYRQALYGEHAKAAFEMDKRLIESCDTGVLVLPAGKSGHLELGIMIGQGKEGYILLESEPDRWDLMYRYATGICSSIDELIHSFWKKN